MKEFRLSIRQLKKLYQPALSLGEIVGQLEISLSILLNKLRVLGWNGIPNAGQINLIQGFHGENVALKEFISSRRILRETALSIQPQFWLRIVNEFRKGNK